MTIPAITAMMLMTGAPVNTAAAPAAPMLQTAMVTNDQDAIAPGTQIPATEPATTVAPSAPGQLPAQAPTTPDRVTDQNDIIVTARPKAPPGDPLQAVNAKAFEVTQQVDDQIVAPVAQAYKETVPGEFRRGLRNFLGNIHEPIVFINYLLQFNIAKAGETLGRFVINSTIGLVGLFDVAKKKPYNLPRRRNGLADTLGFYGVKPGPYFYLPLVGSTTLRDAIGNSIDGLFLPSVVGTPFDNPIYFVASGTLSSLDYRIQYDQQIKQIRDQSDPYSSARELYLKSRIDEINGLRVDSPVYGRPLPVVVSAPAPGTTHMPVTSTTQPVPGN